MPMIFFKKHIFTKDSWPLCKCKYCGEVMGLDLWQLREMPKEMAKCEKGERISILEFLSGSINCLEK